jgi:hypothetical protein
MALYTLGRITFPRKADAEMQVREILHKAPLHERLTGAKFLLVLGVLAKHPHADEKLEGGMIGLTVAFNVSSDGRYSRGFQIIRPDGAYIDFSYRDALGTDAALKETIDSAGRNAVKESIVGFKQKAFALALKVPCAVTGIMVIWEDADVHHAEPWPFEKIVATFVEQNGEPAVRRRPNGDFGAEFVYEKDAGAFRKLHDRLAVLQIVSRDKHQRHRHAQLSAIAAEDCDNSEAARSDLDKEFPP